MTDKCRYMEAAYPTIDAQDTCGFAEHRHDESTFALARAFAIACQDPSPSDEQIGWMLEDAAAVIDDFDPTPAAWTVTAPELSNMPGIDFDMTINGVEYVVQPLEWEPSHPVKRTTWLSWMREAEGDESDDHRETADGLGEDDE